MKINYKSLMFVVLAVFLVSIIAAKVSAFAGGDGSSGNPYQITNCVQLQEMQNVDVYNPVHAYYVLMNDIDCSDTFSWNSGKGFVPIYSFAGNFDGQAHKITGLFINGPTAPAPWNSPHYVGLFGTTVSGAIIKNVGLVNANILGYGGAIGGLVGHNAVGVITNSYATGRVTGGWYVGGLVGENGGGVITDSYSTVRVIGSSDRVGGLVGINHVGGTITNSYSTGRVTGGSYVGGLVGENAGGTITNSYWDTQTSGQPTSSGGTGKTTVQMMQQSTYVTWDFVNIWAIDEGVSYPYLQWQIPPIASAGANQTVHEGSIVTLDGSGSSAPNGCLPLTYAWSFVSKPAGSTATLSDLTLVNPTFTADQLGDYIVQLVVTNSKGAQSSPATVTISTYNTPPVADPGSDQAIALIGTTVMLDGSNSFDVDGDPLTCEWNFSFKPPTSSATLYGANTSIPTFVADVHGTYIIQLVVSDPWIASAPETVTVSFTNIKPVANAGTSQSVVVGETVNLNGGGSSDANGDPLVYKWSLTTPAGSNSVIANPNVIITTFIPDLPGTYVVQLIVNDGFVDSDPSTIQVQVVTWKTKTIESVQQVETAVVSIDVSVLKNVNMQNTLINKLNAVIANIAVGKYADALGQLENDILAKTDGCAKSGMPDKNDWITNCAAQSEVYPLIMEAIELLRGL